MEERGDDATASRNEPACEAGSLRFERDRWSARRGANVPAMPPDRDSGDLSTLSAWRGRALSSVELLAEVDSTNAEALRRTERGEVADGRVLLARMQSAGHGSRGRRWESPPSCALALTAWLDWPRERPLALATWLGIVAVVDAAATLAVRATIKWPNDALIGGRKVAGVLPEARHGRSITVALGIGLNVLQREEELPHGLQATSLALAGAATSLADAGWRLLTALDARLLQLACAPDALRDAYVEGLGLLGRRVVATLPDERYRGRLVALEIDGTLVVAESDATGARPRRIAGGHVGGLRAELAGDR